MLRDGYGAYIEKVGKGGFVVGSRGVDNYSPCEGKEIHTLFTSALCDMVQRILPDKFTPGEYAEIVGCLSNFLPMLSIELSKKIETPEEVEDGK